MISHSRLHTTLNLHLFDGAGSGADGGGEAAANAPAKVAPERNPLAKVQYGKQADAPPEEDAPQVPAEIPAKEPENSVTTDTQEVRRAEFEKLIKGDYKDLFDERAQKIIDTRFKQTKALEEQASKAESLAPVLDILAGKYGVAGDDVDALVKAIQEDDSYYEDEAMQKGLTVEQLKHMKRMERENAEFKRAAAEVQRKQEASRIYAQWQEQADACKQMYPTFDLQAECASPESGKRFLSLLQSGVDVQTAFEVVHKDELIGGAMQYTAKAIQQKTLNDIRARGMRPVENGASGNGAAAVVKADPKSWSKKDREEVSRRVMRGERIEL